MYVTRCERRDDLQKFLKEKNIETRIHYPKPNHLAPGVISLFPNTPKLPKTEQCVKEILSLPIHGEMGLDAGRRQSVRRDYGILQQEIMASRRWQIAKPSPGNGRGVFDFQRGDFMASLSPHEHCES